MPLMYDGSLKGFKTTL